MTIKEALQEIVGKTITGVVVKRPTQSGAPQIQIFLLFSDHTYYEFYSPAEISTTGSVDPGDVEDVHAYMASRMGVVFEALLDEDGQVVRTV